MSSSFKLRRRIDATIPIIALALSVFGLVMILSSSQVLGAETYGNSYYFFVRQLISWVIGVGLFFYLLRVPLETLFANRLNFLWLTIILLALVFVPVIGPKIAEVHRWIDLGIFRFQPAELAKLFLVIYFAGWFAAKGELIKDPVKGLLPFAVVISLLMLLIIAEPDLGTAFVIIVTALIMFFVAKANPWQFGALVIAGVLTLIVVIYAAPYRLSRLTGFLGGGEALEASYHSQQALIAIGSGGLWGVGFGQGTSKYAYLPQSHTDSIFAVIAEELGFVRASLIILGFLYLAWRGFMIARAANSRFVQLLAVGITTSILLQAMVNIGGMLNLIPLTGVPLPLVSYGGSSLVATLGALGLLTNISRET